MRAASYIAENALRFAAYIVAVARCDAAYIASAPAALPASFVVRKLFLAMEVAERSPAVRASIVALYPHCAKFVASAPAWAKASYVKFHRWCGSGCVSHGGAILCRQNVIGGLYGTLDT